MVFRPKLFAATVLAVLAWSAGPAAATVYTFVETSSTLPGVTVQSTITVNGTLADLPSITWEPAEGMCEPYACSNPPASFDFGALTGFTFSTNAFPPGDSYSLADFDAPPGSQYCDCYMWSISSGGIYFNNSSDEFGIGVASAFTSTTGFMNTDSTLGVGCGETGACQFTGYWAVPEPPAVAIFATGLLLLGLLGWRSRQRTRPCGRRSALPG